MIHTINVTNKHMNATHDCRGINAINRAVYHATNLYCAAGTDQICVFKHNGNGHGRYFTLPSIVRSNIIKMNGGHKVEPFSFDLDITFRVTPPESRASVTASN